jgi:cation transport ATPase
MTFSLNPIVRAINAPLMLWNAYPIALRAWHIWRRESRLNVDFLDTLAITASVAQNHHTAGALITWLVKLGDWFRDLTMAGSKRAIGDLLEFQSKTAWIKIDGLVVSVPARALKVGDEVVVYPGEVIPVDGEILDGNASIDQKTITGEGLPATRGRGEAVLPRLLSAMVNSPLKPCAWARKRQRDRLFARSIPPRLATPVCKIMPRDWLTVWSSRRSRWHLELLFFQEISTAFFPW